jgi:hypothetical protein
MSFTPRPRMDGQMRLTTEASDGAIRVTVVAQQATHPRLSRDS